jgi:hypothetical protein
MRSTLILFVLLSFQLFSQAQTGFEYRQKIGFLIAHRSLMAHLPQAPAIASELSYIYRTKDQKKWHQAYRQPLIGGTLFYGSVGNNQILGRFVGMYGFVELPIVKKNKYRLDFRFGTGLGYTNKPFDIRHRHDAFFKCQFSNAKFRDQCTLFIFGCPTVL